MQSDGISETADRRPALSLIEHGLVVHASKRGVVESFAREHLEYEASA